MTLTPIRTTPVPTQQAPADEAGLGAQRRARRLFESRGTAGRVSAAVAFAVVALALAWAFLPGVFAPFDPLKSVTGASGGSLAPPGFAHWFGTDHLGRDVFSRVVYGAGTSLRAATIAVTLGLVVGFVLGALAGYVGGRLDEAIMRCVDVLLAVPGLLLSLVIVTVLGFGELNIAIAVGAGSIATFARLVRAEVLSVRRSPYVEASVAAGTSWPAVLVRHVVPNSSGPVVALVAIEFGSAILSVSALSFLGFGTPPPAPEWGSLVAEGRNYLATAWWLTTLPGLVVIAVVLAGNRLGHAIGRGRGLR